MNASRMIVLLAALSVSACTEIPGASSPWLSYQPKIQSVAHWETMAEDIADHVAARAGKRAVYVQPQAAGTVFGQAFHTLLVSELIERGVATGPQEPGALTLSFETQVVAHANKVTFVPVGFSRPTRTELLVTTSLDDGTYVWSRETRGYYLPLEEWKLYEPQQPVAQTVAVLPLYVRDRASY